MAERGLPHGVWHIPIVARSPLYRDGVIPLAFLAADGGEVPGVVDANGYCFVVSPEVVKRLEALPVLVTAAEGVVNDPGSVGAVGVLIEALALMGGFWKDRG